MSKLTDLILGVRILKEEKQQLATAELEIVKARLKNARESVFHNEPEEEVVPLSPPPVQSQPTPVETVPEVRVKLKETVVEHQQPIDADHTPPSPAPRVWRPREVNWKKDPYLQRMARINPGLARWTEHIGFKYGQPFYLIAKEVTPGKPWFAWSKSKGAYEESSNPDRILYQFDKAKGVVWLYLPPDLIEQRKILEESNFGVMAKVLFLLYESTEGAFDGIEDITTELEDVSDNLHINPYGINPYGEWEYFPDMDFEKRNKYFCMLEIATEPRILMVRVNERNKEYLKQLQKSIRNKYDKPPANLNLDML